MFFKTYWVLGQNARNLKYIKQYNNSFAKYIADSKLRTKEFLWNKWIWVPETFFVIKNHKELEWIDLWILNPPFVVKPNNWFWWKGILIFDKIDSVWNYITNTWEVFSKVRLIKHFSEILDWFYSLSWTRDRVLVEQKLEIDTSVELLWKYWLPDIRLVVFNMTPIMAMIRIPTKESWGKANLHSWACWAWIDIWTWKVTYITQHDKIIKSVPWIWDIRWMTIPHWEEVLTMWVALQKHTSIWYLACDIVLDSVRWPLLLEVNIRPWLNLQIANRAPLHDRLKKVEWISVSSVEKWVRLWKDLFGWDLEEKVKNITWKKILWAREFVSFLHNEKEYSYISTIQISQTSSFIDREFLVEIFKIPENQIWTSIIFQTRILWEDREIKFSVKSLDWVNIILWKNALKWFYIDPFKYKKWDLPENDSVKMVESKNILIRQNYETQLNKIDKALIAIDKKLTILNKITPNNLFEEKIKFTTSRGQYIPQLKYDPINIDFEKLKEDLNKVDIWEIPMSPIFKRKKDEIYNKIMFFEAFSEWDCNAMQDYSTRLFWNITQENLDYSFNILESSDKIDDEKEFLDFSEIHSMVKKFNHIYWINLKLVEENIASRFAISWDKIKIRPMAEVWKRELRSIIAHEIEGHYLKKVNWKMQDYKILRYWTAWYISDEEWVAIYNQNRFLTNKDRKFYNIFDWYIRLNVALSSNYGEFLEFLKNRYNEDYSKIFNYILRLKRWMPSFDSNWVFMKDVVYVNGYINVKNFLDNWWNLKDLYLWKIWIIDLKDLYNDDFPIVPKEWMVYPLFM